MADSSTIPLLPRRKVIAQIVGFLIGLALLVWCIHVAVKGGDWGLVWQADPLLIAGLLGCSVVSLAVNAAIFWLTVRPLQRVGFWNMQWLNLTAGLLNYLPVRAGLIARIAYHLRIDRMSIFRIGGWFLAVGHTIGLAVGSCALATIVRPQFDLVWLGITIGLLLLGGWLTQAMMRHPIIVRHGRGMDRMLADHPALWGSIGLRLIDIAAYTGRFAFAAAILGLTLPAADIILLALAALALGLNPLGRFGFREWGVAIVASRLATGDLGVTELDATFAQLALIESAGEALVFIPLGAVALIWYLRQWRKAGPDVDTDIDSEIDAADERG